MARNGKVTKAVEGVLMRDKKKDGGKIMFYYSMKKWETAHILGYSSCRVWKAETFDDKYGLSEAPRYGGKKNITMDLDF